MIGLATYSKEPLSPQVVEAQRLGSAFIEVDLSPPMEPGDTPDSLPLPPFAAHLPEISFDEGEVTRCIEFIRTMPAETKVFVIHLYSRTTPSHGDGFKKKVTALNALANAADERGAVLAIENTDEDVKTIRDVLMNVPKGRFCLDVGHANLWDPDRAIEFINDLGEKIVHLHVHDNDGGGSEAQDTHRPIGNGTVRWPEVFKALRNRGFQGNMTLELHGSTPSDARASIEALRHFERRSSTR